ncbi:hypothetical protein GGF46_002169 [Coemansia sp. RSA 552]|nr:hypothetical protein GGF46_002169 [Coemansia sp. RSA 552]
MEIVDRQAALITNYEVLLVLREEEERHKDVKASRHFKYPENVNTLKFEALKYLGSTPCTTQSGEQIAQLKAGLAGHGLTKAEVLQIINLRPRKLVELHPIIEECDERFEEAGLEDLLGLILEALPRDDDEEEAEEEEVPPDGDADMDVDDDQA